MFNYWDKKAELPADLNNLKDLWHRMREIRGNGSAAYRKAIEFNIARVEKILRDAEVIK